MNTQEKLTACKRDLHRWLSMSEPVRLIGIQSGTFQRMLDKIDNLERELKLEATNV